jgi:hypothetical protein
MKSSKLKRFGQQVKQFAAQFVPSRQALLGQIIPLAELEQWVREEAGDYRERKFGPLRTLMLFIEQVMGTDHSCQDAVARGASQEVARTLGPCSLNTGPYCKARKRLPLGLLQRLSRAVAERLSAHQAEHWKWRGREVKLVDGTTVSMPDTQDNRAAFPLSKGQKGGSASRGHVWWGSCRSRAPPWSIGRWVPTRANRQARPRCCGRCGNNSNPATSSSPIACTRATS